METIKMLSVSFIVALGIMSWCFVFSHLLIALTN